MRRGHFSLDDLPTWATLNGVYFNNVQVANIDGRGNGLITTNELASQEDDLEPIILLKVPRELVLSPERVEEYAKENKSFRQLLDTAGHKSARGDILLFLLYQLVLSSPDYQGGLGPSTSWTQYFNLLPSHVPSPTTWTESEWSHLRGTSLESALAAKLKALTKEFDDIQNLANLFWRDILSFDESVTIQDWILLDALFRSRSLALPNSGESMVPCIDLVNHSSRANAFYEETSEGEVVLYLRKGCVLPAGSEITIDYGQERSPAEILFNYGFIDSDSHATSMTLLLKPLEDDPLALAKFRIFREYPKLRLEVGEDGVPRWTGPFVYLMCLNEEDGLEFRVLQMTDRSQHLALLWQGVDITDAPSTLKDIIRDHELYQVFELRALVVVLDIVEKQLDKLLSTQNGDSSPDLVTGEVYHATSRLRSLETDILRKCVQTFNEQKAKLLQDDTVVEYLTMGFDQNNPSAEGAGNDEDFS
ncbi:SET domain-containing protein [Daldinia bambusicola]|nr:SET domain-containing protein [Daldinia bambusicola]